MNKEKKNLRKNWHVLKNSSAELGTLIETCSYHQLLHIIQQKEKSKMRFPSVRGRP